jgi:type II secretion system protein G
MTTPTRPRARQGFTLVEMLVVIVIIGILAGLITAAAFRAQIAAKRAVIKMEIAQLAMALESYKNEYGAYPPDFFGLQHNDTDVQDAAKTAVIAHLRKRFPRCQLNPDPIVAFNTQFAPTLLANYNIRAADLDSASALVFWLGGLPADSTSMTPAGFHQDPTDPFRTGLPRTKPLFEFNTERYVPFEENPGDASRARYLRFYPAGSSVTGNQAGKQLLREGQAPYVYFKSRRLTAANNRYDYALTDDPDPTKASIVPFCYVHGPQGTENVAVPYLDEYPGPSPHWDNSTNAASTAAADLQDRHYIRRWRNLEKYQIICAGLDGQFGNVTSSPAGSVDAYRFRFSKTGNNFSANGEDFDNLTNFAEGTLEDEM